MGLTLPKKSLDMGPDFQNLRKILLNHPFLRQKTIRNGSQFSKFPKKRSNQPFLSENILMGRGFGVRAAHPRQNIMRVPTQVEYRLRQKCEYILGTTELMFFLNYCLYICILNPYKPNIMRMCFIS